LAPISFCGSHKGSFTSCGLEIHVGSVGLNEQLDDLKVAVGCCTMERSSFIVDCEALIDQLWFFVKEFLYFREVLALDMPE